MEIITKQSPRWGEFIKHLDNLLSEWDCKMDLEQTQKALGQMNNVDTEETLQFLRSKGGFCDCEVMMNVYGGDH